MTQGLGQGIYEMGMKHLLVLENKEVLKTQMMRVKSKGHRNQQKELPIAKAGTI